MRRWVLAGVALFLLLSMAAVALAADDMLTVSGGEAGPGEFVYLAVRLNDSVKGDAVGVVCQYDPEVLVPRSELSQWQQQGLLQDFDGEGNGVWATGEAVELKGKVCILAFQVAEDSEFSKTEVECTVMVKNGTQDVGTYSAKALVTCPAADCDHSYGSSTSVGDMGHEMVCSKCAGKRTEAHNWDDGVLSDKPEDTSVKLLTRTCSGCGETDVTEVPAGSGKEDTDHLHTQETGPTTPEETVVYVPNGEMTLPTAAPDKDGETPGGLPQDQENSTGQSSGTADNDTDKKPETDHGSQSSTQPNDHTHIQDVLPNATQPGAAQDHTHIQDVPSDETGAGTGQDHTHIQDVLPNATQPGAAHDHTHETGAAAETGHDHGTVSGTNGGNLLIAAGLLAVAVVAGILFLKKKR